MQGDVLWIRQQRWVVHREHRESGIVRLEVVTADRRTASAESGRRQATFLAPFDRPAPAHDASRPRRVRAQHALARLAALVGRAPDLRLPIAAIDARASILPHQLEPAAACLDGCTRLLIADEVGLGKTIQAGLILAELMRREPGIRALVLAPAALRDQWAEELRARFAIAPLAADRHGLDALTRAGAFGDNPWRRAGVWLASPDFLKQRHVLESMPVDPWDLLILDEAHAVCGDSDRYDACQRIARRSRRVILLTATPHSGDEARFSRLVDLGRLRAPLDGDARERVAPDDLQIFRRTRRDLGWSHARAVRWMHVALSADELATLDALSAYERAVVGIASTSVTSSGAVSPGTQAPALLLLSVFRKRALSTFEALSRSLARRLAWLDSSGVDVKPAWTQRRLWGEGGKTNDDNDDNDGNDGNDGSDGNGDNDDNDADNEWAALTVDSGLSGPRERAWLRRLRQLAERAARRESKVARVVELIRRAGEPAVVFTEFRDSLAVLERRLSTLCPVSVLHGGQDAGERRLHLHRFLSGSSSVLLATDVAGQGLNLQSRARWVISLELPWNPARLEQRIGRVDRITQARPTHFTLTVARHPAERGLLTHLARRVLTAQRSFGTAALDLVAPPESDIGASLLLGCAVPSMAPRTTVHVSTRWQRPAAVVASALIRRRTLAGCWRDADGDRMTVWTQTTRGAARPWGADSFAARVLGPVARWSRRAGRTSARAPGDPCDVPDHATRRLDDRPPGGRRDSTRYSTPHAESDAGACAPRADAGAARRGTLRGDSSRRAHRGATRPVLQSGATRH